MCKPSPARQELCEDAVAHLVRAPAAPSAPGRGDAPSSACYIVPQRVSSSGVDAEGIEWRQSLGPGLTIAESREWNDVALTTWEACLSLASFLVERPGLVDGLGVLELGAGLGLLGCMLARFCRPTHVVLTDCSEPALDRMEDTLASNILMLGRGEAGCLEWVGGGWWVVWCMSSLTPSHTVPSSRGRYAAARAVAAMDGAPRRG